MIEALGPVLKNAALAVRGSTALGASDRLEESSRATLPTFLIIGAPRCGTTSLHGYLAQHPAIYMSAVKEPNYFLFDAGQRPRFTGAASRLMNRDSVVRERDYRDLFRDAGRAKAIGEASPKYLSTSGTAARIKAALPDVKLIAILRNPVDRALSDFALRVRDGWEPAATIEDAIGDEQAGNRDGWGTGRYLHRGFYAHQLREYFREFPEEQIRIYLYEDLCDGADWLFRDIFGFLGVDHTFRPDTSRSLNVSGRIRNPLLRFLWTKTTLARDFTRPAVPREIRRTISDFFVNQPKDRIEFPSDVRRYLQSVYREDIVALQTVIGRDLSKWLEEIKD